MVEKSNIKNISSTKKDEWRGYASREVTCQTCNTWASHAASRQNTAANACNEGGAARDDDRWVERDYRGEWEHESWIWSQKIILWGGREGGDEKYYSTVGQDSNLGRKNASPWMQPRPCRASNNNQWIILHTTRALGQHRPPQRGSYARELERPGGWI